MKLAFLLPEFSGKLNFLDEIDFLTTKIFRNSFDRILLCESAANSLVLDDNSTCSALNSPLVLTNDLSQTSREPLVHPRSKTRNTISLNRIGPDPDVAAN